MSMRMQFCSCHCRWEWRDKNLFTALAKYFPFTHCQMILSDLIWFYYPLIRASCNFCNHRSGKQCIENCIHFSTFITRVLIKFHAFELKTLMIFCVSIRRIEINEKISMQKFKKDIFCHYQNLNLKNQE